MVLRQPIYEKDRMDPVDPAARLSLDAALLAQFPEGYRHLAYLQTRIGYEVKKDMPGLKGAEVEALYGRGNAWLTARSLRHKPTGARHVHPEAARRNRPRGTACPDAFAAAGNLGHARRGRDRASITSPLLLDAVPRPLWAR